MDAHFDADHGRAVLTYGGVPELVLESCADLLRWAVQGLDLKDHTGAHPRFGVVDVLPLVPYGVAESVVSDLAVDLTTRIESLGVPVHTYGRADRDGRSLPELRRFLRTTPHRSHPTAGIVCLGIRDPLVAFNANFEGDISGVRSVARDVRAPEIRALGFELASRGLVQVSMNLIEPERLGPKTALDRVVALARKGDLKLVDCEVVGLVPHPILAELEGLPLRAPVRSIEQALEQQV